MEDVKWKMEDLSDEIPKAFGTKPDGKSVPRSSSKEFLIVKERSGREDIKAKTKAEKYAIMRSCF